MKTAIKLAGGGVAVMLVVGDVDVDECIEKWKAANPGQYVSHREMPENAIPADRRLRAAWADTTPDAVIDIDTTLAKACITGKCDQLAKAKRDAIVAGISAAEMASWPIKLAEANKFTETGVAADAPNLAVEAQARDITLADLVVKVLVKATALSMIEAGIAGTNGRHNDAIAGLSTVEELQGYDLNAGWPV